jgi:tetrahydromethanopterin S-methyltransferase subunit B
MNLTRIWARAAVNVALRATSAQQCDEHLHLAAKLDPEAVHEKIAALRKQIDALESCLPPRSATVLKFPNNQRLRSR